MEEYYCLDSGHGVKHYSDNIEDTIEYIRKNWEEEKENFKSFYDFIKIQTLYKIKKERMPLEFMMRYNTDIGF